jgi:acyl carrier protein
MENVKKIVRDFIMDNFLFDDTDVLKDDISLLEEGILDSTGVLELIDFLEKTFSFSVDDDELNPENFDSINNIGNYLKWKLKL